MSNKSSPGVLYVLVCGSPIARDVGVLVDLAQRDGWEVCVITTPDGRSLSTTRRDISAKSPASTGTSTSEIFAIRR